MILFSKCYPLRKLGQTCCIALRADWVRIYAYVSFCRIDGDKCIASLPQIFHSVMTFVLSDSRRTVLSALEAAKVSRRCILHSDLHTFHNYLQTYCESRLVRAVFVPPASSV